MDAAMAGITLPDDLYKDKSYKLVITTVVSFVIATFGLIGRFVARFICRKRLELNDYLLVLGYVFKTGLLICSSLLVEYGIGKHIYILTPIQITKFLKATWTGSFIYAPAISFVKLSILSLYYVAFPSRFMKIGVWILAAITIAWGVALCFTGLFACIPIDKSWTPEKPGHCIDQFAYYWGLQIPNIVTDFLILLLPFRDIYLLHLPRTQLLQIAGVLSLGLVTCAIDIVRLRVFLDIPKSIDISWIDLAPAMWLDLETSIAILCACLPVMRPLLHPSRFYNANRRSATGGTVGTVGTVDTMEGGYSEVHSSDKHGQNIEMGSHSGRSSSGKMRMSDGSASETLAAGAGAQKRNYN